MSIFFIVVFVIILLTMALLMAVFLCFFRIWTKALASKCHVPFVHLIGMKLRGSPPSLLVDVLVALHASGIEVGMAEIEAVYIVNRASLRRGCDKWREAEELVQLVKEHRDTMSGDSA